MNASLNHHLISFGKKTPLNISFQQHSSSFYSEGIKQEIDVSNFLH